MDDSQDNRPGLTPKQLLFVAAYAGNASEAARIAGYANPSVRGCKLLKDSRIQRALKDRESDPVEVSMKQAIADRAERQAFWTSVMRGQVPFNPAPAQADVAQPAGPVTVTLSDRLRASELLGKSCADFIDVRQEDNKVLMTIKRDVVSRKATPKELAKKPEGVKPGGG